jgi:predicted ATPase/class 3 adenylate cyclase
MRLVARRLALQSGATRISFVSRARERDSSRVAELPTGTVTFLFTDIEGSTRLLRELGDAYADALAEHRLVLREAFGRYGGVEVDTQGDAFFVAFAGAGDALAAAAEAQAALVDGRVRVRMGLHTGTPLATGEGYVGEDVHLGARVAAAAHGGQVVLSRATADLVDWPLVDLGEHRLKDFDEPVWIYQLGEEPFPPLKTISNTNLPRPASSFVGRKREVGEVVSLVREGARLVTLTGPGGSGKSRLAMEAALEMVPEFRAGVFWIGLAALRDPTLVLDTVAETIGGRGALATHIGERELFLLLDNLEQVIEAAPDLAGLVEACPNLVLLVTSRELLRVRGEVEYQVLPLAERDAVALFSARAQVGPSDAVEELCRHLDNMPLALELAAARAGVLPVAQIVERVSQRLDLFKGGRDADPRQQTLRATIEWSHDLLSAEELTLFRRLSVFVGGFTLAAAEAVCDTTLDVLQSLVDKSLVRRTGDRFWMLETIRDFAVERLDSSGEAPRVRRRHAGYFLELAGSLGMTMESVEAIRSQRHDVAGAEWDNFRQAIDWAMESDRGLALAIAVRLENAWVTRSPLEGRRLFGVLLEQPGELPLELQALAFRCLANAYVITGERKRGVELYEESLDLYRQLGDERGAAIVSLRVAVNRAQLGDPAGHELVSGSLARARELGLRTAEAQALGFLGEIARSQGDPERAIELLEDGVDRARAVGFTWTERNQLETLAYTSIDLGRFDQADEYAREGLVLSRRISDRLAMVGTLGLLSRTAAGRGDRVRAGRLWGAVEAEEARGSHGLWDEGERNELAAPVLALSNHEFEQARLRGRLLSLDEAVDEALSAGERV